MSLTKMVDPLQPLQQLEAEHPLWRSPLLLACADGALHRSDLEYVFSQYYLYSRNFTRYLAALMTNCEDDYFRARLSQNLWEEGGGCDPARRHAQLLRNFLAGAFGIAEPDGIVFEEAVLYFVREYLYACADRDAAAASAFLSLGTEAIVPRLYTIFLHALRRAGVAETHLAFFRIHIESDDEHARTLKEMTLSYARQPGWFESCARAVDRALSLRARFFASLFRRVQQRRLEGLLHHVQARRSLLPSLQVIQHRGTSGQELYDNRIERLNIEFQVDRLPFRGEVLDTRLVKIPPRKNNELHRHAHEALFYVLEGVGRVLVDDRVCEVASGDFVMVPRWSLHQAQNTGASPLVILAVTDFGLTEKAYFGDYDKTARLKRASVEKE